MRTIDKGGEGGLRGAEAESRRGEESGEEGRRDGAVFTRGDSTERLRCGGERWLDGATAS